MSTTLHTVLGCADRYESYNLHKAMSSARRRCNILVQELRTGLDQSRDTAFEHSDINSLVYALNNITTAIAACSATAANCGFDCNDSTTQILSVLIDKSIDALYSCISSLRHGIELDTIRSFCHTILSLENEADSVFNSAVLALFSSSITDTVALIRQKDLYQDLEFVTDKCEDAAHILEAMAILRL